MDSVLRSVQTTRAIASAEGAETVGVASEGAETARGDPLRRHCRRGVRAVGWGGSGRSVCQQHHQRAERQIGDIREGTLAAGPVGEQQDDRGRATR